MGCRDKAPRASLLRVVSAADGVSVVADARSRLPGRGAWLHHRSACLDLAERRRAFARALRLAGPVDSSPVRRHLDAHVHTSGETTTDESGSSS
ncbi:YlxR family protein [Kineococcus gynurae]|uniref:YlxR family protein n=1 Tax=Kineococcus gynurae TaxID=452979 RepID=A0ABV5LVH6_9ACTN